MFTNWLTGTTGCGGSAAATHQNSAENRTGAPSSNPPNNTGNIGSGHILMSTPPDVILEIGTVPSTVRFVAHSIVLGMHSGYLRSAIRLDERTTASNASPDFILYLGNVTAEQFAPLLTYMYTGYLDLNVENIFGVLLATHVLHMPRALEICRAFLARAQTEGYLGARLNSLSVTNPNQSASNNTVCGNGKIIRPIASKPTIPAFGFLPALTPTTTMTLAQQQQQQQQQFLANYKGLQQRQTEHVYPTTMTVSEQAERQQQRAHSVEIDVDQESTRASGDLGDNVKDINKKQDDCDDDEDEEVFIDSSNTDTDNDDSEVIIECRSSKLAAAVAVAPQKRLEAVKTKHMEKTKHMQKTDGKPTKQQNRNSAANARRDKRRTTTGKQRSSSGLQIAKAPIPASQLDANEGSKVIVDVASCDGPVRFRRILNTAYGHKPEDYAAQVPERSQQSVSLSFHQQMARTINQQRQQMQQQSGGEESENSESSGGCKGGNKANASTEIYVCVYCKHTFKSQYCYQKHAKRHLNPLSLSSAERCAEKATLNAAAYTVPHATSAVPIALAASCKQSATEMLRREVRPLDMNVQYYPCKTCGSKFPSYYFVHKHRKMCHADEEAAAGKDNAAQGSGNGNDLSGTSNMESDNRGEEKQEPNEVGDNEEGNIAESKEHETKREN